MIVNKKSPTQKNPHEPPSFAEQADPSVRQALFRFSPSLFTFTTISANVV